MTFDIRSRLAQDKPCIGGWLTVPSPAVAEAMASCGFHWVAVDMEHNAFDEPAVMAAFAAIERHGAAPFARLSSADPYQARRVLDMGAVGLIVPVVESADDFATFAKHCFYPPKGKRGVGLGRANLWGDTFESYTSTFEPLLIPQIETRRGADAVAEIVALAAVSGVFIGPYDLSADMGIPGAFNDPRFKAVLNNIFARCRKAGKAPGIHHVQADLNGLKEKIAAGFRFVAYSTDMTAMRHVLTGIRPDFLA